jgi:hypothetical protein
MNQQRTVNDYLKAAAQARRRHPTTPCLSEEQLIAFYSRALNEHDRETVRQHLAECSTCVALARVARTFLQTTSQPIQTEAATLPASMSAPSWFLRHRRELFLLAAMVLITLGVVLLLGRDWRVPAPAGQQAEIPSSLSPPTPPPRENPWRELKIAKAEYTPPLATPDDVVWRGGKRRPIGPPTLALFAQAMQPYQQNDFAEAERQLGQFLENNPHHAEANLYRGVSLLLLDKITDAIAPLQAAIEHGPGRVREAAHWYLALAYLKSGEPSKALQPLDAVIAIRGTHRAEAEKLRQQIRDQSTGLERD